MIRVLYLKDNNEHFRECVQHLTTVFGYGAIAELRDNAGYLKTRGGIEVFVGNVEVRRYIGQRFDMLLLSDRLMENLRHRAQFSHERYIRERQMIETIRIDCLNRPTVVKAAVRFMLDMDGSMVPHEDGEWVRHE
ncbi:hypothetical protein PQD73_gp024 [Stenotrophomonas phage Salva]|uniref:Uncharacterized protein n=1 Tax=Stenotrophomonas phage Salva TaxID=2801524 RepID=A0A7U3WJV5_9CAUD|nr:hypothetical protein PQD73_gp024 [Stenotrophomonas phage Salva]QQM18188.1 hypothetical protein CPT_Salva_024 [Stenotrophomonas phage Salva]